MKRFVRGFALFFLLFSFLTGVVVAQTQTGKIVVVSVPDRYKSANKNQSTTGLKTVGVGSRVVLSARVYSGTGGKYADTLLPITSATWTLTSPYGVAKSIQDTAAGLNGNVVYFVPDTVGDWTVSMTATTVLGTAATVQMKVTAAKFMGAGISLPTTQSVPSGCACHLVNNANFASWSKTNHATAVKRKTQETGGHFAFYCFSCHSAGYDGVTTSGNDGFDDIAKLENFTTVPTNAPGVFDTLVAKYPMSMARTGIQCENCHGPAGQHVSSYPQPGDNKLDETLSSNVCAPCHFSSDRHGIGYAWSASAHANSLSERAQLQYTDRPICAKCHTAQGYINETIGGKPQPVPPTGTLVYSNPMPIGCSTCHDPHDGSNEKQLRVKTVGDACIGCHITRISGYGGLHTSNQGSMLIGVDATPFTFQTAENYRANSSLISNVVGTWGGWQLPGYTYENSSHSSIKERCVQCHMADSPSYLAAAASNFKQPDTLITKLGRHTFRVNTSYISGSDTLDILNPTGCAACHGTPTMDFVDLTQAKTQKLLDQLFPLLPKRDSAGTSVVFPTDTMTYQAWKNAPNKRKLTVIERAAAYNYIFVKSDKSFGVHNFNYAKGLLTSSLEQMKLSAGAASVVSIKDVPVDNGKNVQVVWNAFPAEQYSYNQVVNYGIWRKDPILPSLNSIKKVGSFTELMQVTNQGGQAVMGGSVWTFVASVPASGFPQYSYVAPTLFDSTKVAGQRWTVFYVAGYTKDNQVMYSSQPDSGYSVDNISPAAPTGTVASFLNNKVTLKWTANIEADVYQYAIYRGTTANFDPTGTTPLAKVRTPLYEDPVSQSGVTYYYKISAVDVSGNESGFSTVSVVTSVENSSGVPTEFALNQNYPNPFNPTTEIAFSIPKQSPVKIVIYGLSGEAVATLVNQTMSAGNYRVTWNGRTDDGGTVASGVYFYHLQAEGFTATKKMTLLK